MRKRVWVGSPFRLGLRGGALCRGERGVVMSNVNALFFLKLLARNTYSDVLAEEYDGEEVVHASHS